MFLYLYSTLVKSILYIFNLIVNFLKIDPLTFTLHLVLLYLSNAGITGSFLRGYFVLEYNETQYTLAKNYPR